MKEPWIQWKVYDGLKNVHYLEYAAGPGDWTRLIILERAISKPREWYIVQDANDSPFSFLFVGQMWGTLDAAKAETLERIVDWCQALGLVWEKSKTRKKKEKV